MTAVTPLRFLHAAHQ